MAQRAVDPDRAPPSVKRAFSNPGLGDWAAGSLGIPRSYYRPIEGSTGSGKTTLLNALARFIPDHERIITIEDTSEIYLRQPNVVRFESRPAERFADVDRPRQAVTIRDLLKEALRHRPDRLILGEVRLEEASELLQALNTGHRGSFSTIHPPAPQCRHGGLAW